MDGFVVRKATVEDREALLDLAAQVFYQKSGQWLAERSWHRLSPEAFDPTGYWLATTDAAIIGIAAFRPFVLNRAEVRLPWIGVGTVCTAPQARGRGVMSALLQAGIDETNERGYAVSILWGDRLRYGRYGWEQAGRQIEFSVSRRQCPDPGWSAGSVSEVEGKGRHTRFPQDLGRWMSTLQRRYTGSPRRDPKDQVALIARPDYRTVWVEKAGEGAYAVFKGEGEVVRVYEVVGSPELVLGLIGYLVSGPFTRATCTVGPPMSAAERALLGCADRVHLAPTGMARIHDLAALLGHFEAWWAGQWRPGSGELILAIDDGRSGDPQRWEEAALLSWTPQSVRVTRLIPGERPRGVPVVAADRRGMAQIVFGPLPPDLLLEDAETGGRLRQLFPLPLNIPLLDRV